MDIVGAPLRALERARADLALVEQAYRTAGLVPAEKIDPEVIAKLDGIVAVAGKAKPKEV